MESKTYELHTSSFWDFLNGDPSLIKKIHYKGPEQVLPSVFDVTAFASASIGVATLAVAELKALRSHSENVSSVEVDSIDACVAFRGDFKPLGWELPSPWDAFAGDYQAADAWIRLHTNYSYHRDAVFKILGVAHNKEELAKRILSWKAAELEEAIVEAGGCSAVMYDRESWSKHPHGKIVLEEPPIRLTCHGRAEAHFQQIEANDLPLQNIRVLDITRVIAGPVCTKFLSAHGAQVLRIDPPSFDEVPALLPETTVGKKRSFLHLKSKEGFKAFENLLREAHVFVHGLRPEALEKLGITTEYLSNINPSLVVASLDAYGWEGPWKTRRGFDSLVQMSSGIAAAGARAKNSTKPIPLPVQALDHGIGYLLAAGVCRSLSELYKDQKIHKITASLIGASNSIQKYPGDFEMKMPDTSFFVQAMIKDDTFWGPAERVRCPGTLDGKYATWRIPAGPLGLDQPKFFRLLKIFYKFYSLQHFEWISARFI